MKIICMGGGTGLPEVLRGIRDLCHSGAGPDETISLTAVVCVSDNGGSSGSLRQAFGIPAVGDLRNCLVALSNGSSALGELFQHRLGRGDGLSGHALGNLVMTALCERTGSLREAVHQASVLLQTWGRVMPSTEHPITLCAEFQDGAVVRGEVQIAHRRGRIGRMWLEPEGMVPTPGLAAAIMTADVIVFGPGSLYTSVIPNLLVPGIARTVQQSAAMKILVCNLMTQPGETDGFRASDHLHAVEEYVGTGTIDACIMNAKPAGGHILADFEAADGFPVENDVENIMRHGTMPVVANLLRRDDSRIRHDSAKLAEVIAELACDRKAQRDWVFEPAMAAAAMAAATGDAMAPEAVLAAASY